MSDVQGNCPLCGGELDSYGCQGLWNGTHQDAEIRLLTAERDRFRVALQNIEAVAAWPAADLPSNREQDWESVFSIARAALEGET